MLPPSLASYIATLPTRDDPFKKNFIHKALLLYKAKEDTLVCEIQYIQDKLMYKMPLGNNITGYMATL